MYDVEDNDNSNNIYNENTNDIIDFDVDKYVSK